MPYKAGHFYMPTSGGLFSLTDFGLAPQGVIFFGGNQSAEDTFVTTGQPGVFFGMTWTSTQTGLHDSQAISNVGLQQGKSSRPVPINQAIAGGSIEYQAEMVSLDPDGFTLNVTVPAPGPRLIHYLAYGDFDAAGGASLESMDSAAYDFDLGYQVTTGITFHDWTDAADHSDGVPSPRISTYAAGQYFSLATVNWPFELFAQGGAYGFQSNATSMLTQAFSNQGVVGFTDSFFNHFSGTNPGTTHTVRVWFLGIFLDAWDHMGPIPGLQDGTGVHVELWGFPTRHSMAWWTGEGNVQGVNTLPALGLTTVHIPSPNVGKVEACLFFGNTGYNEGVLGPQAAYGYGVLAIDDQGNHYQGCVGWDSGYGAGALGYPTFYQSKNKCYVERYNNASGVRAASGEIIGNEVHLTTEVADAPAGAYNFIQMYGDIPETPGFFRRFRV